MKKNSGNPKGIRGRMLLRKMRECHKEIFSWGLSKVKIKPNDHILDIGCGDGFNIHNLLTEYPETIIYGLDISPLCCKESRKLNKKFIKENRCKIIEGDIKDTLLEEEYFDLITAFCTLRFWSDLESCAKNIFRCLKKGGVFLIADHGGYDYDEVARIFTEAGFEIVLLIRRKDKVPVFKITK